MRVALLKSLYTLRFNNDQILAQLNNVARLAIPACDPALCCWGELFGSIKCNWSVLGVAG